MVEKERKVHEETYLRIHNIIVKDFDLRIKIYKDISDNLEYIGKLYEKGFHEVLLEEIRQLFSEKYKTVEE